MMLDALALASHSLRRQGSRALFVILTLAFGIGAFCATASAIVVLGSDPLEGRGAGIYHPQLDPTPSSTGSSLAEPPDDMTLTDARNVYRMAKGYQRVITSQNWLPLMGEGVNGAVARMAITRATTRDFFAMFGARMQFGAPWSAEQEARRDRVVVLSARANEILFGGADSTGRKLTVATKIMTVVGVLRPWTMVPKVYDLNDGPYSDAEELFMPFETWIDLPQDYGYGPMRCFGASDEASHDPLDDRCTWVQAWVTIPKEEVDGFVSLLRGYSREQQLSGRYSRAPNVRLRNAVEWLDYKNVVPAGAKAQFWVAVGLLMACLLTVSGLQGIALRARFAELGLRRALGASNVAIIVELAIESALLGTVGGALGVAFGFLFVRLLRFSPENHASYMRLEVSMVAASLFLAIVVLVASSLAPARRAVAVSPYRQMHSA